MYLTVLKPGERMRGVILLDIPTHFLYFEFVFAFSSLPRRRWWPRNKQTLSASHPSLLITVRTILPAHTPSPPPKKKIQKQTGKKKTQKARQSIIRVIACSQLISDDERPAIKMFFFPLFFPSPVYHSPGGEGGDRTNYRECQKKESQIAPLKKKHRLYGDI